MKKFTAATAKSFIKKNKDSLLIRVKSDFDGMTDCVEHNRDARFVKAEASSYVGENNQGINGVWFVLGGRDYFTPQYVNEVLVGFGCSNCCGSWEVCFPA